MRACSYILTIPGLFQPKGDNSTPQVIVGRKATGPPWETKHQVSITNDTKQMGLLEDCNLEFGEFSGDSRVTEVSALNETTIAWDSEIEYLTGLTGLKPDYKNPVNPVAKKSVFSRLVEQFGKPV